MQPMTDDISFLWADACPCGMPRDDAVFCSGCRAKHEALPGLLPVCAACGAVGAVLCDACASTEEYCSCGAGATQWVPIGVVRQPMCDVCASRLPAFVEQVAALLFPVKEVAV